MTTTANNIERNGVHIRLTYDELVTAGNTGVRREASSVIKGHMHKAGYGEKPAWTNNCEGACGEVAFAKFMDRHWGAHVNARKEDGDVGPWQVRTTTYRNGRLVVYPDDADDAPFVLVTGQSPDFYIVGWIHGRDAKRAEWLDGGEGRPKTCYFVPQAMLRTFDDEAP